MFRIVLAVAVCTTTSICHADIVHAPISVSSPQGSHGTFLLEYMIDQSGLSSPYVSGVTEFDSYVDATTHRAFDNVFRPLIYGSTNQAGHTPQQVTFDLGEEVWVTQIAIWSVDNLNTFSSIELYSDSDDSFSNGTELRLLKPTDLHRNAPDLEIPIESQVFEFVPVYTRYLHLNALPTDAAPKFLGLSEVVFGVVPSPQGAAVFGLAALMSGLRRRVF